MSLPAHGTAMDAFMNYVSRAQVPNFLVSLVSRPNPWCNLPVFV